MKRQILTKIIMAFILFGVSEQTMAQLAKKYEFTVNDAVAFAQKNNMQVKNALLAIQVQKETNREITAAAFPTISGSVGVTDYLEIPTSLLPGQIFGQPAGTYIPVQFGTKFNSSASLQLQQLLFDGQVFIGLQARKTSIEFQTKNYEITTEAIKANIHKIYYQLVLSKTQIALLDANISRLQKLNHDAGELYKNGFAEKLDIDKISVQLSNLQTEKIKALNNINIGYMGIKTLMGMPVKDTLVLLDKITEEEVGNDFSNDTTFAYTDRKEFQYLNLAKKLNEFNIKRYQLSKIPTLALNGVYSKNAQRNKFDFFGKGDWFPTSFVALNLNVPLFNGFAKTARISKSRIELQQTENQIENLKMSIDTEVEQAKINFKSAIATMKFQKQNMDLAEKVYNQTKKKYEAGTGSNTEINSAQTDLITAQTNYMSALYNALNAKIDYYKAIGKL